MEYAIRIQALDGYDTIIQTLLESDRFSRTIRVHHTGKKKDNPHYHLLLTTDYKQQALRAEMKKHFTKASGNKHLSIKQWDGNIKAVAYLFHEGTIPDCIKNFTDEELTIASEINTQVQAKIKANASAKIIQDATDFFRARNNCTPVDQAVFQYIFIRLKLNGDYLPCRQQYERWTMRIQANLRDEGQYYDYMHKIFADWYGRGEGVVWYTHVKEEDIRKSLEN